MLCESLSLKIQQQTEAVSFGSGHAECGKLSVNWKAYRLLVGDGRLYRPSGEAIGEISAGEMATEEINPQTGSVSRRQFRLEGGNLLFTDSITDAQGEQFFLLQGALRSQVLEREVNPLYP